MRERTGPVSWLEAAVLTFPEPGYRRGSSGSMRRCYPPPERAGPAHSAGPLTVAGPRRILTGFRMAPFAVCPTKVGTGADRRKRPWSAP